MRRISEPYAPPATSAERRAPVTRLGYWVGALLMMAAAFGAGLHLDRHSEPEPLHAEPAGHASTRAPDDIQVPEGMIYVPGGVTHIGSNEGSADEQPIFRADVDPFLMDQHPVTVAEFETFVAATGFATDAERVGDGAVLDVQAGAWHLVPGANWRYPLGPAGPPAPRDHPVTQVSWNDAAAYAAWAGKRLPTEVEWEHAARGARDSRSRYAWGDALGASGSKHANTWEGSRPTDPIPGDPYLYTSPVGTFGATELGLTDMGGNVWEWTADWYRPYAERGNSYLPVDDEERVQRGGSFLCRADYCHGYRVSARSHSTPETALFHVGFRTVRNVE